MEAYVWSLIFVGLGLYSVFTPPPVRSERERMDIQLPLWGKYLRRNHRHVGFALIAFGILWALIGFSGARPQ